MKDGIQRVEPDSAATVDTREEILKRGAKDPSEHKDSSSANENESHQRRDAAASLPPRPGVPIPLFHFHFTSGDEDLGAERRSGLSKHCGLQQAATAPLPTESTSRYRCADAREASQERNRHNGSILWTDRNSRKAQKELDCGLSLPESRRIGVEE